MGDSDCGGPAQMICPQMGGVRVHHAPHTKKKSRLLIGRGAAPWVCFSFFLRGFFFLSTKRFGPGIISAFTG